MLIILIVFIGLSLLILGHEAGHFFVAKLFNLKVDEFGFGFPPRIVARKRGETDYSINWLPFGGFVKIAGEQDQRENGGEHLETLPPEEKKRLFLFQPAWKRSVIIGAGVIVNFLIGWLLISFIFMIGVPSALVITDVQKSSPAETAGIKAGDNILEYAPTQGQLSPTPQDKKYRVEPFIQFVTDHRGEQVTLTLRRQTKQFTVTVIPRLHTGPNEGPLGIVLTQGGVARHPVGVALRDALPYTGRIAWATITAFVNLVKTFFSTGTLLEGVVGPVGIFVVAEEAGRLGLIYLIQLLAVISINLAVVNLIPFPALDGGRLLMVGIEKIKGSPISRKTEAWINGVGFVFLIILIALVSIRDIKMLF